jgi:hypothetical protein
MHGTTNIKLKEMGVLIFQAVATGNDPRPNTPRSNFPLTINRHGRVQRHRTRAYTVCFGYEQHYCNGCVEVGKSKCLIYDKGPALVV